MPPKRQLAPEEVAALEQWVKLGAPDPRAEAKTALPAGLDIEAGRRHWAFQPLANPAAAGVAATITGASRRSIALSWRGCARRGWSRAAPADRRTLIRRATFDLTGLPPSSEEVEAFVRRHLAGCVCESRRSPARLAALRRALGAALARCGPLLGHERATSMRARRSGWVHAWPYRDWVVRALNEDMPYDRFLLLQLAADQVEPAGSPELAAMGFLTLGRRFLGVTHDIIDDRIDVVMRSTQALTVACARCHDHKFDPIPTRDYYALYGVFQSCAEQLVPCGPSAASEAFEQGLREREDEAPRDDGQAPRGAIRPRPRDREGASARAIRAGEISRGNVRPAPRRRATSIRLSCGRWQSLLVADEAAATIPSSQRGTSSRSSRPRSSRKRPTP